MTEQDIFNAYAEGKFAAYWASITALETKVAQLEWQRDLTRDRVATLESRIAELEGHCGWQGERIVELGKIAKQLASDLATSIQTTQQYETYLANKLKTQGRRIE